MRFISAVRGAAPLFLSVTMLALPALAHGSTPETAPARIGASVAEIAGFYNLTLKGSRGNQRVDLILEPGADGYSGRMVTGGGAVELTNVQLSGDTIRATVMTSAGRGELVLHVTEGGMVGCMRVAKRTLPVTGDRAF